MQNAKADPSFMALPKWLTKQLEGQHAPTADAQRELAFTAERLVRLYLGKRQPLRRAAAAKKLGTLSTNLNRAAKAAFELGEDGVSQMLLASDGDGTPERVDPLDVIAHLQDWSRWSTKAAEIAQLMSRSAQDHRGGATPDERLRGLVTILMDRFEALLGIKAAHTIDPHSGLGHSMFDLFVKEAIRLYAPEDIHFEPRRIDDAISWALPSRSSSGRGG